MKDRMLEDKIYKVNIHYWTQLLDVALEDRTFEIGRSKESDAR